MSDPEYDDDERPIPAMVDAVANPVSVADPGGRRGEYVRGCNVAVVAMAGVIRFRGRLFGPSLATRDAMLPSRLARAGWFLATLSSGAG